VLYVFFGQFLALGKMLTARGRVWRLAPRLDVVKHHPQQRQVNAVTRFWRRILAFLEYLVGPCPVCGALGSLDGDEGDGLDGLCLQCGTRSGETSTPGGGRVDEGRGEGRHSRPVRLDFQRCTHEVGRVPILSCRQASLSAAFSPSRSRRRQKPLILNPACQATRAGAYRRSW
jgi:hypothetical protein